MIFEWYKSGTLIRSPPIPSSHRLTRVTDLRDPWSTASPSSARRQASRASSRVSARECVSLLLLPSRAGMTLTVVMTAGLVASQFLMYGGIKSALGAKPGIEIHKE